ncbi:MAG: SpoIID/LytB domain-containing protein [Vulcanococcus sp.]
MGTLRPLIALLALAVALPGCQGAGAQVLTHLSVPAPPAVGGEQQRLWVALAPHLGASPLVLQADQSPLRLRDGAGLQWQGQRLSLRWRLQQRPQPLEIRRTVLGPFSSFESAEQAALAWRAQGVEAVVAHPSDWEVWAPATASAPKGYSARLEQKTSAEERRLQVSTPSGWKDLQEPVTLEAPGGLRWDGGVFAGPFRLQSDAYGSWTLVEQVPLERYLLGVVPHEIGAGSPAAALAAQAVLARTWALGNQHRFAVDGYHLCADTQCQVYRDPRQAGAAVRQAITATSGQVLSWQGKPIHAVYHASNGGVSADEDEAWRLPELAYLEPRLDHPARPLAALKLPLDQRQEVETLLAQGGFYGSAHPYFRWQRQLTQEALRKALGSRASALGTPIQPVVLERGPSGRVVRLALRGPSGQVVLERDAIRRSLRQLPSTLFVIDPLSDGGWRFRGGGFGHGAGLSQAGAIDLASRGWSVRQILDHYYPGAALLKLDRLPVGEASGEGS